MFSDSRQKIEKCEVNNHEVNQSLKIREFLT